MTYAFGHLVGAWIVGKISKIKSSYTWFFLLLGSLIPDADYLIDWTLHTNIHRTITHSFFFLIIAPFFLYLILTIIKDPKNKEFSLAFAIGIFTHYMLDMFFHHGIPLFWPHPFHFSYYGFGYPSTKLSASFDYSVSFLKKWLKIAILDMAIGSSWIFYLLLRRKIKF